MNVAMVALVAGGSRKWGTILTIRAAEPREHSVNDHALEMYSRTKQDNDKE